MIEYKGKKIIIMCCSQCNMSCEHCYISYTGNRDPEELLEMVKKLKGKYIIALNGAEVLTNPRYLDSYQEINQNYILSNGLVFDQNKEIINQLREHGLDSVSISYHFGIHDQISKIPAEKLEKIFKRLNQEKFQFRLMTTITSKNYQMLEEMCNRSIELGARGLYLTNYMIQGNAIKNEDSHLVLEEDQINTFFEQLIRCREKFPKDVLLIERDAGFGKNNLSNHDHFYCPSMNDLVVLAPNNYLYPCIFLTKDGYEIGKYENGKCMIQEEYYDMNDGSICYAKEICNHRKQLIKRR
ncbi:MAG: radical SAM protein [Bacilli bacterium]|nr:radical SAM protein [Bacilli bacterium]